MRHLLAVDLDAPVLVVVPSIFGVGAEASSSGHALGVDAILKNTLVQDHGAHGLGAAAREAHASFRRAAVFSWAILRLRIEGLDGPSRPYV